MDRWTWVWGYLGAIVAILAQVLPHLGGTVGNDDLTNALSTIITVLARLG
jgi:uncharacterized membrane protein